MSLKEKSIRDFKKILYKKNYGKKFKKEIAVGYIVEWLNQYALDDLNEYLGTEPDIELTKEQKIIIIAISLFDQFLSDPEFREIFYGR